MTAGGQLGSAELHSSAVKAPKTSKGLLERALALHRAGKTKEAEGFYVLAISRDARNHQALFALSALSFETGRFVDQGMVNRFKKGHPTLALPASWLPPCFVQRTTSTPSWQSE